MAVSALYKGFASPMTKFPGPINSSDDFRTKPKRLQLCVSPACYVCSRNSSRVRGRPFTKKKRHSQGTPRILSNNTHQTGHRGVLEILLSLSATFRPPTNTRTICHTHHRIFTKNSTQGDDKAYKWRSQSPYSRGSLSTHFRPTTKSPLRQPAFVSGQHPVVITSKTRMQK